MYRILKNNSFLVSFYGWNKVDLFLSCWKSVGFYPVGNFIWVKNYSSKQKFVGYNHEGAYLLAKGRPAIPNTILDDVLPWEYSGNALHPNQKPVMALTPIIQAFTKPGDLVLDPFAGSGSTAVAAKLYGRRYLAIELDPKHSHSISHRLNNLDIQLHNEYASIPDNRLKAIEAEI